MKLFNLMINNLNRVINTLINGMKSYHYVDLSMNDDCVQYSILYPSMMNIKRIQSRMI